MKKHAINKISMIKTLFTSFLIFFCFLTLAQNNCSDNLERARTLFNDGFIEDLPSLLIPCLDEGFSREEKISAYKLLIITYLFDDNQTEAEGVLLRFFKDFPNYEVRTDDPVEFVYLLESFEAVPVFSVYGSFGINQSVIQNKKIVSSSPNPEKKTATIGNTGITANIGASYNLSDYIKNINVNLRLEYSQYSYTFEEEIENTAIVSLEEKQFRINVPFFVSYNLSDFFSEEIVSSEVYIGSNFEFVASAQVIPGRNDFSESPLIESQSSIKSMRRSFEPSILLGSIYSYPLTKGFLFVDLHTKIAYSIQNKNRWSNGKLWSKSYYVDNNFLLHNIYLNIGYKYTFHKPTKVR